jgi:hypothetical protein
VTEETMPQKIETQPPTLSLGVDEKEHLVVLLIDAPGQDDTRLKIRFNFSPSDAGKLAMNLARHANLAAGVKPKPAAPERPSLILPPRNGALKLPPH